MSPRNLTVLFGALFLFMLAWSVGLATPLINLLGAESEMARYLINKGVLTLVFGLALWRFKLFASVGFSPGMGLASYAIGLPLLALGVLAFFEPGRPVLTSFDFAGWTVVILFVAFTEETLFRGVLWQAMRRSGIWKRAICTSVMFGLIHMIPAGFGDVGWSIASAYGFSAAGFGMVFAAMRERAKTIWSVIVVHVVFDIAAISASGGVEALLEPGPEIYVRFLSAAVVFAAWGSIAIWLMKRRTLSKGQSQMLSD